MKTNTYTTIAIRAAVASGKILTRYYTERLKVEYKGAIDPVTKADKESQKLIFSIIHKAFPAHTVVGEEDIKKSRCAEYCWIVDPLDGTVNFIHGIPLFAVSIALSHNGTIIAGVVYNPLLHEMFVAQKGGGAYLNGKRVEVSHISTLQRALAVTGFPYTIHAQHAKIMQKFAKVLTKVQGMRRLGSASLDLAYVACGRFEAFWEEGLKVWDVAAGTLILEEAGGKVTDFSDGADYLYGEQMLATNKRLHRAMLRLIRK